MVVRGRKKIGGMRAGRVCTNPDNQEYIGAESTGNNDAELSAFVWAMTYALQYSDTLAKCHIMYDAMYAAHTADSTWKQQGRLGDTARAIFRMLHGSFCATFEHEAGHMSLPFNELADTLCTVRDLCDGHDHDELVQSLCIDEFTPASAFAENTILAQWPFVAVIDERARGQYPVEFVGDDMYLAASACPVAEWGVSAEKIGWKIDKFQEDSNISMPVGHANTAAVINVVQVNANTLKAEGKRQLYFQQLRREGAHVFCSQEHRHKHTRVKLEHGYVVAQSGCNIRGNGGCMVALSASLPFGVTAENCHQPLTVGVGDVSILHADHRRLLCRVAAPRFQCVVVSLHGLDRDYGQECVGNFWCDTGGILHKCIKPGDRVIACVDAKCRITERNGGGDTIVGGVLDAPSKHTFVTDSFTKFCRGQKLKIENTFDYFLEHGADDATLHTSLGVCIRCDYLLFSIGDHDLVAANGTIHALSEFKMDNKKRTTVLLPGAFTSDVAEDTLSKRGGNANTTVMQCLRLVIPKIPC